MRRILIAFALAIVMVAGGCASKGVNLQPGLQALPKLGKDLLKGNPKIYFQGVIQRDRFGFIDVLISGRPESFPVRAGITLCVASICHTELIPVMNLRYYKFKVPATSHIHSSTIPVVIGLRHVKGIHPLYGYVVYEREPFVERTLLLEYQSTMVKQQRSSTISFTSP